MKSIGSSEGRKTILSNLMFSDLCSVQVAHILQWSLMFSFHAFPVEDSFESCIRKVKNMVLLKIRRYLQILKSGLHMLPRRLLRVCRCTRCPTTGCCCCAPETPPPSPPLPLPALTLLPLPPCLCLPGTEAHGKYLDISN